MSLTIALLVALSACAPKHEPPWVADLLVEGPDARGAGLTYDPDLPPLDPKGPDGPWTARGTAEHALAATTTETGRWWRLLSWLGGLDPHPSVADADLSGDAERARVALVDAGWPEATVTPETNPTRVWWSKHPERWQTVTLRADVGLRATVGAVRVEGLSALHASAQGAVRRLLPPVGSVTSEVRRAAVVREVRAALSALGDPLAAVSLVADPPDRGGPVTLTLTVLPTGQATAGAARVSGTTLRDADRVAAALSRAMGQGGPWRGARVEGAVDALADQPVVAAAELVPTAQGDRVDADVRVAELPRARAQAGVSTWGPSTLLSLGLDTKLHVRTGRTGLLTGRAWLGWRLFDGPAESRRITAFIEQPQTGPGARVDLRLAQPLGPLSRLDLFTETWTRVEAWRGFSTASQQGDVGLAVRPDRDLTLSVAVRGEIAEHFAFPTQAAPFAAAFGPEGSFERRYGAAGLSLRLRLDTRDGERMPTRGSLVSADVVPIGTALGQRWSRAHVDARTYLPVIPGRMVLALRGAAGVHTWDDTGERGALMLHRFHLGGLDGPRGFGPQRLGPPGTAAELTGVYPGGDAMLFGSVEGQWTLHPDVVGTLFVDVGRVWESAADKTVDGRLVQQGIRLTDLQPTAGVGLVVRTPLGGLITWVGVRLAPDTGLTTELPRALVHMTLAPEF